jgi:lysozyme family protein
MSEFDIAIKLTLSHEGGKEFDKAGGETNFGISLLFLKTLHPKATADDIKNLTIQDAIEIYRKYFWEPNNYVWINSQRIASKVFDLCVNLGQHAANSLLQSAVNTLDPESTINPDGVMGGATLRAINECKEPLLYDEYIKHVTKYYNDLVAINPDLNKFLKGWLNRLNS